MKAASHFLGKQASCDRPLSRVFDTSISFRARRLAAILLFLFAAAVSVQAASPNTNPIDGTYPGRIFTEIARHRQSVLQRVRSGFFPQSVSPSASQDVGNVAVLTDDGILVTTANSFDLDNK